MFASPCNVVLTFDDPRKVSEPTRALGSAGRAVSRPSQALKLRDRLAEDALGVYGGVVAALLGIFKTASVGQSTTLSDGDNASMRKGSTIVIVGPKWSAEGATFITAKTTGVEIGTKVLGVQVGSFLEGDQVGLRVVTMLANVVTLTVTLTGGAESFYASVTSQVLDPFWADVKRNLLVDLSSVGGPTALKVRNLVRSMDSSPLKARVVSPSLTLLYISLALGSRLSYRLKGVNRGQFYKNGLDGAEFIFEGTALLVNNVPASPDLGLPLETFRRWLAVVFYSLAPQKIRSKEQQAGAFLSRIEKLIANPPEPEATGKRRADQTSDHAVMAKLGQLKGKLGEWHEGDWGAYQYVRLLIGTAELHIKTGDMPNSAHLAQPDARARYQLRAYAGAAHGHPRLCEVGFNSGGSILFTQEHPEVASVTSRLKGLQADLKARQNDAQEKPPAEALPDDEDDGDNAGEPDHELGDDDFREMDNFSDEELDEDD